MSFDKTKAFEKCTPFLSTNIKQCGTVTVCDAKPLTADDLDSVYMTSGDYRVMEAILMNDMEIKQCEAVQNGMYEFIMANKVNMSKKIQAHAQNSGLIEIAPFIKAKQYSPINNEYWYITGSAAASADDPLLPSTHSEGNWRFTLASTTNIPVDARSFPLGQRIYIDGVSAAGSSTKTAWVVTGVVVNSGSLYVWATHQHGGSHLHSDKLETTPTQGLVRRGTPNVNDFEQWCNEAPAYLNWRNVPFWVETTRHSMCKSSLYDKWRALLMENNPLYREWGDLDDIEKNRQLGADWQRRFVNSFFWNKPISAYQTLADYDDLDEILTYTSDTYPEWGVDGAKCIGKRANAVGVYEQMAECERIVDLQGGQLNLPALFQEIYNIMRVREGNGQPSRSIDIFTDTVTAEKFNQAMIKYYNSKSDNTLRMTKSVDEQMKTAEFGFNYRSYVLFWPNVTINIVTHYYFDDYITGANVAFSDQALGRVLWILDFSGIYPGILASNRVVNDTGDLKTMAAANPDWACVMRVPTQQQTLTSVTWTCIVECPASNLIVENFSDAVPEHATLVGDYSGSGEYGTTGT